MSETVVQPWITVNGYMRDDYREAVVEQAVGHLREAPRDLCTFATRQMSRSVRVPGYRSVTRAPAHLVQRHVVQQMQETPGVATAVVCLWADVQRELIDELRSSAEAAGLRFREDWCWREAQEGFCDFDAISDLAEIAESLAQQASGLEADHFRLAALWLSLALVSEESVLAPIQDATLSPPDLVEDDVNLPASDPTPPPPELLEDKVSLPVTESTPSPPESMTELQSVATLVQELRESGDELQESASKAASEADATLAAIKAANLTQAEAQLVTLEEVLGTWRQRHTAYSEILEPTARAMRNELELRPDLDPDQAVASSLHAIREADRASGDEAEVLAEVLEQINSYDYERDKALEKLEKVQADTVGLQVEIAEWDEEETLEQRAPAELETEQTEVTLEAAQAALAKAVDQVKRLERRLLQLREASLSRITTLADSLREDGLSDDTPVINGTSLGDLDPKTIAKLATGKLKEIEQKLNGLISEQALKAQSPTSTELAAKLRVDWGEDDLTDLLSSLAAEKRGIEAFVLLLAANAVHPRSDKLSLDAPVVESLLRGVEQFSDRGEPFELLNLLAPDFLQGWAPADSACEARLCLSLLAAQYAGSQSLPAGLLWQVRGDWPMGHMPSWGKLWQAALTGASLPEIVSTVDGDLAEELEEARRDAEQSFSREGSVFLRLRRIRNRRHQILLGKRLMPELASRLAELHQMERRLSDCSDPEDAQPLLAELRTLVMGELPAELDEDRLIEEYEADSIDEKTDPSAEFHRRTALGVLQDCAQTVLRYGEALLAFWSADLGRDAIITREALQRELAAYPELSPLGQVVLEHLAEATTGEQPEWNGIKAREVAYRRLTHEILGQPTYVLRLPHLVSYLTGAQINWTRVIELLLDDLAEPMEATDVAVLLIERGAPTQVLLLTQHIPLELQKEAQALTIQKEQEVTELQAELLKLGGSDEGLTEERKLGRWGLVHQELEDRLKKQQEAHEVETSRIQDQARQFRREINELDESVFDARATMPKEAYQLVERGLTLARKATGIPSLFGAIEAYLEEIRYRLQHESWPLADLQTAAEKLDRVVAGETVDKATGLGVEEVLDLLERGELRRVGLNPEDVASSEVETRCTLLESWLAVRELPAFLSRDMDVGDYRTIQRLYQYFARMVAMRRFKAVSGSYIIEQDPAVYSHWELRYPKTAVLDNNCVFLAMPGNPPSPKDLKELENLVEDKEWLDYYFVFLFVPGCTLPIRKRLESLNRKRGLVILDESAILEMVLAEAQSKIPLGCLRPLMLRARGTEDADVFRVNQLVEPRSAIFVGRDALINRIASRSGNYALYGGRRIGKSSVLKVAEGRFERRGIAFVSHSFEGDKDCSDDATAVRLAELLGLDDEVRGVEDLKTGLQALLDTNPDLKLVLLLDEIDRYVLENPDRHVFIELLRALSDRYGSRFCVVIAGFMSLYDCLQGRGPYTPTSDPWRRMFIDVGLKNLQAVSAERIVQEGFLDILGWQFENRAIPQWIVERTGGHPAFVQDFCFKVQQRVASRGDRCVRFYDIEETFADRHPDLSFIAYVRKTLRDNLDPLGHYVILWLAEESSKSHSFTRDQALEIANTCDVPEGLLDRSLERLKVTSVVEERSHDVYEFSVPDYPLILHQLGDTAYLRELEDEIEAMVAEYLEAGNGISS